MSAAYSHTSVLLAEVVEGLKPRSGGVFCDGTLGGGGHAAAVCEKVGAGGTFVGIDRDGEAIAAARARLECFPCRKVFAQTGFEFVGEVLAEAGIAGLNGAVLDLGVSSRQLDEASRGFSYMQDGPLDMRMGIENGELRIENDGRGLRAVDIVNEYSEGELARVIFGFGEERWAKRIAAFIVKARLEKRIGTTFELVEIIKNAIPASARREGPHPAKRTFQALRIEVNDELGALERGIEAFVDALLPGGRLAIITFHSLEDRIVKEAFRRHEDPCECPRGIPACVCGKKPDARRVAKKPILPTEAEVEGNPRARSAKLRILEKIA